MKATIKLLAFSVILLAGCGKKAEQVSITSCWKTQAIENAAQETVKRVSANDKLCLREDSTFYYYLQLEMVYATGSWSLEDSVLILDYDYLPANWGVDTVLIKGTSLLNYKVNGSVVKRIGLSSTLTKGKSFPEIYASAKNISRKKRSYHIQHLSPDSLVFEEKGIRFKYTR